MTTKKACLGSEAENPFHYQKLNITMYRIGFLSAAAPLQTDNDKKFRLNSLQVLAFESHGHGVPFCDFPHHYVLVFDLTSTQQASHDYLYPEFNNVSV